MVPLTHGLSHAPTTCRCVASWTVWSCLLCASCVHSVWQWTLTVITFWMILIVVFVFCQCILLLSFLNNDYVWSSHITYILFRQSYLHTELELPGDGGISPFPHCGQSPHTSLRRRSLKALVSSPTTFFRNSTTAFTLSYCDPWSYLAEAILNRSNIRLRKLM